MTFVEGGEVLDSSGNPSGKGYVKCKSSHMTTFSAGSGFTAIPDPVIPVAEEEGEGEGENNDEEEEI